jgi:hypothetical protein
MSTDYPNIRPSLLLDFANTKKLDPRITFTRTTTATYYDGVTTAKAEQNLLTYSQEFDNAAWSKTASTVTANSTTAPDGTSTADTLTETATTNYHSTYQTNISLAATSYTFSCFAKPNGRNEITLVMLSGSDTAYATYNVSTGSITVAATTSGSFSSASTTITASANGFYRVTLTATAPSTSTATIAIELYNAARSYAGNGTSGVYLWGAQLEQRSSATAYTATTTQAITNYIPVLLTAASGVARFDHNPTTDESLGLLIEEQRTNLLLRSEDFGTTWAPVNVSVTVNTIVAPSGQLTGDKLVEDTANGSHTVFLSSAGVAPTAVSTTSVYAKAGERTNFLVRVSDNASTSNYIYANFNLSTGAINTSGNAGNATGASASITAVGNGWYRCVLSGIPNTSGTTTRSQFYLASNTGGSSGYTGDGYSGLFIWGAQLEDGAFATSYIATTSATVTRNADAASMTGTNFSSWFNNGEGTVYADYDVIGSSGNNQRIYSITDSAGDGYYGVRLGSTIYNQAYQFGAAQASLTATNTSLNTSIKNIFSVKTNDFAACTNAASPLTDTTGLVAAPTTMYIGTRSYLDNQLGGHIRKLAYYPVRCTNAQLQALTA